MTLTDRLECGENWQRQRGDLDRASYNVGNHKHAHAQLPSPTLVGRSAALIDRLLVFEEVGLALECKSDGLQAGRDEAHDHSDLIMVYQLVLFTTS
jgi:hypothetical protein